MGIVTMIDRQPLPDMDRDGEAVRQEALTWPDRARALRITDATSYERAAELLQDIKGLRGKIADTFDPHVTRAHQAHKALLKEKADAEAPLTDAERVIKSALVTYDTEQARIRREQERRIAEDLRRQEEQRRIEEAAAMEQEAVATGDVALQEEAEALMATPVQASAVVLPTTTPKVQGIVFRETWAAQVHDLGALVAYVAAHPELRHLVMTTPNMVALNQMARSLKSTLRIPGVQAVATRDVAAGRR